MTIIHEIEEMVRNSYSDTLRREYIESFLKEKGISFEQVKGDNCIDIFSAGTFTTKNYNFKPILVAHYDTVHPENAYLDNTTGVIMALLLKMKFPKIGVLFTDKEEPPYMGRGARLFAPRVKKDNLIINLDIFGTSPNLIMAKMRKSNSLTLLEDIFKKTGIPIVDTPFQDGTIFDMESVAPVIALSSANDNGGWYHCHDAEQPTLQWISEENLQANYEKIKELLTIV